MRKRLATILAIVLLQGLAIHEYGIERLLQLGIWITGSTDLGWLAYTWATSIVALAAAIQPRYGLPAAIIVLPFLVTMVTRSQQLLFVGISLGFDPNFVASLLVGHLLAALHLVAMIQWGLPRRVVLTCAALAYMALLPVAQQSATHMLALVPS